MEFSELHLATTEASELVEAGAYSTAAEGFDRGLVILALGFPYWLEQSGGFVRVLVERAHLLTVQDQLKMFERESRNWPPVFPTRDVPVRRTAVFTPLLWGLIVLAVFWVQRNEPGVLEASGAVDAQAIFGRNEYWRPFTALFLHADASHLAANWVSGIFIFSAVVTTLGLGRGWGLLTIASMAANLVVAHMYYPEPYRSLGASTALFAGLGLLTGRAARGALRIGATHLVRQIFIPLASGFTLLALFGAGGFNTDLGAHVSGFLIGTLFGCLAGTSSRA